MTTRRLVLTRSTTIVGAASTGLLLPRLPDPERQGASGLHPACTGTFAQLGVAIENGVRMRSRRKGRRARRPRDGMVQGRRRIRAVQGRGKRHPVQRDKVDVLIGTVHSDADGHAARGA